MAQNEKSYGKTASERLSNGEAFFSRMKEKSEFFEHEIKKYGDSLDHYIKKNPVKATVIAGVAGLLLGKFIAK